MNKRVTYTKGITDGDVTEYGILLDGEKIGTVERSRETSTVCYSGVNYGRPVTRTEWWARGFVLKANGEGTRYYGSGYGRTTRKDAVAGLLAARLGVKVDEARKIIETQA